MIQILNILEFQVLAAAKGIQAYYGFPGKKETAREEISFAVYQLARAGILKQQGGELIIQEPTAGYMELLASARGLIVLDRGQYRLPRQCIYSSRDRSGKERYLCLENSSTDADRLCLSALEEEELELQMEDLGQLPDPRLEEGLGDYDFESYWNRQLPEGLWNLLAEGLKTETEQLLGMEQVHSVFSHREKHSGRLLGRLILLDFPLEYCLVIQEGGANAELMVYSRKQALEYLKRWWREEDYDTGGYLCSGSQSDL